MLRCFCLYFTGDVFLQWMILLTCDHLLCELKFYWNVCIVLCKALENIFGSALSKSINIYIYTKIRWSHDHHIFITVTLSQIARFTWPTWAPCGPHDPCYHGCQSWRGACMMKRSQWNDSHSQSMMVTGWVPYSLCSLIDWSIDWGWHRSWLRSSWWQIGTGNW